MAKFKNKTGYDVYLDLGGLRRIAANEVVELKGTYSVPPLTFVEDFKPAPKSKPKKTRKKPTSKGTSGTI